MTEEENAEELIRSIESCCLLKLPTDCDDGDHTSHYRAHANTIRGRIGALRRRLANTDVSKYSVETRVKLVSCVLGLIHELHLKGPWSPDGFQEYAATIEEAFTGTENVSLDRFTEDAGEYRQAIFDTYTANMHKNLTPDNWKKYPATIELYCTYLEQIQDYYMFINLDPVRILPASLLFIDDHNPVYKRRGLNALLSVLKCLKGESFKESNYQLVIYESLNKLLRDKDLDVLRLTFDCMVTLLPLFSSLFVFGEKWSWFDKLIKGVIDDIYIETDVVRKACCFEFLSKLLALANVESVRCKKSFSLVVCDNLELCSSESVRRVLLPCLLLALKEWLKNCWIVFKYDDDKTMLSLLLKILYLQCSEKEARKKMDDVEAIIICMISLCKKEQQDSNVDDLKMGESAIDNKMYIERLKHIIKMIAESHASTKKCKDKKKQSK